MFYVGIGDQNHLGMIGMATSTDGIHWTKYDNPETTGDLFALSDPIFSQADTGLGDEKITRGIKVNMKKGMVTFFRYILKQCSLP